MRCIMTEAISATSRNAYSPESLSIKAYKYNTNSPKDKAAAHKARFRFLYAGW